MQTWTILSLQVTDNPQPNTVVTSTFQISEVDQFINYDKIYIKLIPRFDPNSFRPSENTNKDTKKKFMF